MATGDRDYNIAKETTLEEIKELLGVSNSKTTKITTSTISAEVNQTTKLITATGKGVAYISIHSQGGTVPMVCVIDGVTLPSFDAMCAPLVEGSNFMLRDIKFNESLTVSVTPTSNDALIRTQINFEN